MSIGEIIAILALLIAIFQTMLAWMSYEGIRLSLSSSEWIFLFITLIVSAFIVGMLFEASGESLLLFFTGNFIINELTRLTSMASEDSNKNRIIILLSIIMIFILTFLISWLPAASHVCMIKSVSYIKIILNNVSILNECNKSFESVMSFFKWAICIYFNLFNLTISLVAGSDSIRTRNWSIYRLMNWLTCGMGVCLGLLLRLIFIKF
ncbi:hypothetical protein [Oscillatoria sp. HE19RPO]|uniref:hypothetical protein n=1 Tax=Oscillatoria sp. HE19RPO TaxID=2954806 RepID=UPI0020C3B06C|nr:hypothetical protein [Oscillatoria sp. HE19RPO]